LFPVFELQIPSAAVTTYGFCEAQSRVQVIADPFSANCGFCEAQSRVQVIADPFSTNCGF
jgi:hypothetical protein